MIATRAQAIADAFALGQVSAFRHAADGMMARIWRLDATSGSYAVKELRDAPDPDELRTRLEASAQLADAAGQDGIHTPRSLRNAAGALLQRLSGRGDGDPNAVHVGVTAWIDGRPCEVPRDAAAAATWLGETVAKLELVPDPPNAPALDPWLARWLTEAPSEARWLAVLEQARRAGRPRAELLESRIATLLRLGTIVGQPGDGHLRVLHTDLQPKNVLVTSLGYALLDFDDAALCSRDRILGRTLVEWLTPGGVHADTIMRFMRAYRSRGGKGSIDDLSDFGYAAAAFLNNVHEVVTADPADGGGRDDSARQAAALLTNPLDLSTLEHVLDLVRAAP